MAQVKKKKHKRWVILFFLLIAVGGGIGYYISVVNKKSPTRSVLQQVQRGTLTVSLSGSGQVSATNQIDVKAKVSEDVRQVVVAQGDMVQVGQVLVRFDQTNEQKAVRDAELNAQSAQLALDKLKEPPDAVSLQTAHHAYEQSLQTQLADTQTLQEKTQSYNDLKNGTGTDALSLLQAQNALDQANAAKKSADAALQSVYDDGFTEVANAFIDLPTVDTGLNAIFFQSTIDKSSWNINWYSNAVVRWNEAILNVQTDVTNSYNASHASYQSAFVLYRQTTRESDPQSIESLISTVYDMTRSMDESVKKGNNFLASVQDTMQNYQIAQPSVMPTNETNINNYTTLVNKHLAGLLTVEQTITQDKNAVASAEQSVAEKTQNLENIQKGPSDLQILQAHDAVVAAQAALEADQRSTSEKKATLEKLQTGADPLDIQVSELSLKQKEDAVSDAKQNLADTVVTAPIDGQISLFSLHKGDTVSNGSVVASIITKSNIADITLTETDASRVSVGNKTTLTFDALPDLTLTGTVASIDPVGTVSQGVVSYTVKIIFDTQDDRVRPGMSVTANIILDVRQNTLLVSSSAVKTQGTVNYVLIPDESLAGQNITSSAGVILTKPAKRHVVQVGASDDTKTEILFGLNEGDTIVVSTITSQASSASTANSQQSGGLRIPGLTGGGGGGAVHFRGGGG